MEDDPLEIAAAFGGALEKVGAQWAVGGSVASSVYGMPRSTLDIDLIVSLPPHRVDDLAREATTFVIDAEALRVQLVAGHAYNVFHATTMTKLDLFPAVGPFEGSQIARARVVRGARVISPEDTLLAKLRWYRQGEERSDRQWRDVLGIVALQRATLDSQYVARWSEDLGVSDLLRRALQDETGGL
jgi:hypothetical protein